MACCRAVLEQMEYIKTARAEGCRQSASGFGRWGWGKMLGASGRSRDRKHTVLKGVVVPGARQESAAVDRESEWRWFGGGGWKARQDRGEERAAEKEKGECQANTSR